MMRTHILFVLRRCKAAELAKARAEKQVAQLAMAQKPSAITSDVKQARPRAVDEYESPASGQDFELDKEQAADPASPLSDNIAGATTVGPHATVWELKLAWAALAERRAALEELLESGPQMRGK